MDEQTAPHYSFGKSKNCIAFSIFLCYVLLTKNIGGNKTMKKSIILTGTVITVVALCWAEQIDESTETVVLYFLTMHSFRIGGAPCDAGSPHRWTEYSMWEPPLPFMLRKIIEKI